MPGAIATGRLVLSRPRRTAITRRQRFCHLVSRVVLLRSLWRESLGRVPIEAMANGIPVLASDRGALPEMLGEAGFVLTIPEHCTPSSGVVPTAQDVAPWVAIIERLWDDDDFAAEHRRRALAEVERWGFDRLARQHEEFFLSAAAGRAPERRLSIRTAAKERRIRERRGWRAGGRRRSAVSAGGSSGSPAAEQGSDSSPRLFDRPPQPRSRSRSKVIGLDSDR